MSVPTSDPDLTQVPTAPAAPPARTVGPAPTGLLRATAIVATVGVVAALLGLLLMLRPVSTPTQACGTTIAFLLEGRSNVYVDPNDLPKGVTKAEAEANNAHPCRERVADQVKVPVALLVGGVGVAILAGVVEVVARMLGWRSRRRQALVADAASPTSSG